MVSRIRIDAHGQDMKECLDSLQALRKGLNEVFMPDLICDQEVYERDTNEPEDGSFAWKGRLVLLADIS